MNRQSATHRVAAGTVAAIRRGPSSVYGNPSWWLTLADGSEYRTIANGTVGYEVWDGMVGRPVTLALILFRGAWRIVGIAVADSAVA